VEIRDDVEPEIIVLALERLKSPQSGA
jgi:hypothetical protein